LTWIVGTHISHASFDNIITASEVKQQGY